MDVALSYMYIGGETFEEGAGYSGMFGSRDSWTLVPQGQFLKHLTLQAFASDPLQLLTWSENL